MNMNLRPKTRQRLLILLTCATLLIGAAGALILVQLHRHEKHRLMFRATAMAAFQQGDYHKAAENFANYLRNDRMDSEAIFDYGVARSKLPQADAKNLIDARDCFKLYMELNPGDVAGEHQLLDIYRKLQYTSEASDLSNTLLQQNPDDVPALLAKLTELVQQQQYQAALPVAFHLNELTPFDVQTQGTTYELMWHLQKPRADLIDRADQMRKTHPNDPRFELLCAVAAYWTGDVEGSKQWLRTAATRPPPDAGFVLMLAGAFDHVGLWTDALNLLQNNASESPAVAANLVQRWWELGRFDLALTLLGKLKPTDSLIGLKAFTLYGKSQSSSAPLPTEFKIAIDSLRQREDDLPAQCWISVLSAITENNQPDVMKPLRLCQDARRSDPINADACYFLGREYLRIGESELALQALRQTTQLQPEWAAPYVLIARISMERGQVENAFQAAADAVARDPQSADAQITLAMVRYQQIPLTAGPAEILPVLNSVEQLRRTALNNGELSIAEIDLLARSDQPQAAHAQALELLTSASASTLKRLAAIDQSDHLGIEKELAERLNQCHPTSPNEALDQVEAEIILGNKDAAKSLLPLMHARPTPGWQTAWIRACEAVGNAGVVSGWVQLADLYPNDLDVQNAILRSPSAGTCRAIIGRTIDRIKTITGDDSIEWKLARADWQLSNVDDQKTGANAAATSMAEVVRVTPGYARPQIIWADALEKLGDPTGAIAHLRLALQIEPDNADLALKLAKLHLDQGQIQELRSLISRIRGNPWLTNSQRIDAAMLYRKMGDWPSAVKLLQDQTVTHRSEDCDLILAQLHAELGEDTDAQQIYDRWLDEDPHNPKLVGAGCGAHGFTRRYWTSKKET
jgi:tetratricopeptide (TPR) repeat protein